MTTKIGAACLAASVMVAAAWPGGSPTFAAEIRILSTAALQSVFKDSAADFERSSGHKLIIDYDTIGGITRRILGGEIADLVIGSASSMAELAKAGKIDAGSEVTISRVGIGLVVPSGTPRPRVASLDQLRQALLAATRVVYADPARGGAAAIHVAAVIEKLGIAEALKPKTRVGAGGDVTEVTLAQGPGALGITQMSEIVGKQGADFVGPLPDQLQSYTVLTGGVPTGAKPSEAVTAFVTFVKSPGMITLIESKGMQVEYP